MARYRFELLCPHCAKTAEHVSDHDGTHFTPRISCGDCLMNDVEIVELVIVSVVPVEEPV